MRARALFEIRRAVEAVWGLLVIAMVVRLLWLGWFPDMQRAGTEFGHAVALTLLAAVLAFKLAARLRQSDRRRTPLSEMVLDLELGALLLTATYVFLSIVGGVTSPIYPLVYALVSFLVTFHRLAVGLPLALTAIGLESVMAFGPTAPALAVADFPGHVAFIVIFALLNVLFLHAEVARQRREHRRRLQEDVASMREEAHEFRLITTALDAPSRVRTREEEEEKLSQGSIETIHQQLFYTLDLLRQTLHLQTCALFWLDITGEKLKLKELASDSLHVIEGPQVVPTGVLAAILKERRSLSLDAPKLQLLGYYRGPAEVAAFAGVPVLEGQSVRGVLVADRKAGPRFEASDMELLGGAAGQVMRMVQSERVFQAVERSKHEHERFYRASEALNRALTLSEVHEAAFEGARGVGEFDFAAITTYDASDGTHAVGCAVGEGAAAIDGKTLCDASSLVSMVMKNKLALPATGEWRHREDMAIFDAALGMPRFESLYVLPLFVKDDVIGTFSVAARRPAAFPGNRRHMLGVIANQVATSIQNGRMVQALEKQATTDGLTGLLNHRTFQERTSKMLQRAKRLGHPVALMLVDIDFFKKVNDTYGHPTGDQVLRGVAAILQANARETDIVARYGGEEFAVVLEATGRVGARQLAERIRAQVWQHTFESSTKGPFQATLSLGVAMVPEDAGTQEESIACADQALYAAKHAGRNRTMCYDEIVRPGVPTLRAAG
jgi:diguanylate cyclase (GGDEF)-like protein